MAAWFQWTAGVKMCNVQFDSASTPQPQSGAYLSWLKVIQK